MEIFKQDISTHRIVLTKPIQNNALKVLKEGGIPKLEALSLSPPRDAHDVGPISIKGSGKIIQQMQWSCCIALNRRIHQSRQTRLQLQYKPKRIPPVGTLMRELPSYLALLPVPSPARVTMGTTRLALEVFLGARVQVISQQQKLKI